MKKSTLLLFALFLLLHVACKKSETPQTTADTQSAPEQAISAVQLEGLSATSTASGSSAANLFDGDRDTNWVTRAGAGPDEGVMASFAKAQHIGQIAVYNAKGDFSPVETVFIYINGQLYAQGKTGTSVKIDTEAINFYIRIAGTGDMHYSENTDEGTVFVKREGNRSSALSEIVLYDEKGGELKLAAPLSVSGTVSASSTLSPSEAYDGDYLFDSSLMFGWAEGASTTGEGETITFNFGKKQKLRGIRIWNGYQRSASHFSANARIKKLSVSGASSGESFSLKDESGSQDLVFSAPLETDSLVFTIDEVYAGEKYKDLVISELLFLGQNAFIRIETGGIEKRSAALLSKVSGSVLEGIIDRSIQNNDDTGSTTVCLRSNNSFVIYYDILSDDTSATMIYDGNWLIDALDKDTASIKIFGKKLMSLRSESPYSQIDESEVVTIFSDTISVDATAMHAGKSFRELVHSF